MDWLARFAVRCSPWLLVAAVAGCDEDTASAQGDAGSTSTAADTSTSTGAPANAATGTAGTVDTSTDPSSSSTLGDGATQTGTATGGTTSGGSTVTGNEMTGETRGESESDTSTGSQTDASSSTSIAAASTDASTTGTSTDDTTTGGLTGDTTGGESTDGTTTGESSDTTAGSEGPCSFSEDFEGYPDGAPWPSGWSPVGGVELADIEGGWGRLRPLLTDYSLARMVRGIACAEPDVSLTFMFTGIESQGIGLYTRHNGGYLLDTVPPGRGYSAFAESFRDPHGIGVWREVGGIEQQLAHQPATVEPDVEYRLRYRVTQVDPSTSLLQAKIWPVGEPEPVDWMVESTDGALSLQDLPGRMTIDAWVSEEFNGPVAPDLLIDDIVVSPAL